MPVTYCPRKHDRRVMFSRVDRVFVGTILAVRICTMYNYDHPYKSEFIELFFELEK